MGFPNWVQIRGGSRLVLERHLNGALTVAERKDGVK